MMKLIACDPIIGLPRVPSEGYRPDRADLISEMKRLGIESAIVRHQAAHECGPVAGQPGDTRGTAELRSAYPCLVFDTRRV